MNSAVKYIISAAGLILVLVLSLTLPMEFSAYRDRQLFHSPQIEIIEPSVISQEDLEGGDLISHIRLLRDQWGTTEVPLTVGNVLNQSSAQEKFLQEFETLVEMELYPDLLSGVTTEDLTKTEASLYLKSSDPASSVIIWYIEFSTDNIRGEAILDDSLGKLVYFYLSSSSLVVTQDLMEENIDLWANYLGLRIQRQGDGGEDSKYIVSDSDFASQMQTTLTDSEGENPIVYSFVYTARSIHFGLDANPKRVLNIQNIGAQETH